MIRLAIRRRPAPRRFALRFEGLESRRLMSVDALAGAVSMPVGLYATPVPADSVQDGLGLAAPGDMTPSATTGGPFNPAQIRRAYGFDQLPYDGTGQTIAIIDAYDNPTIASDLATFSTRFGLPQANLTKVYVSNGQPTTTKPAFNNSWATEIALDVEWAHAIAPGAKILLVETPSASTSELFAAVRYAVSQGANQVSMSFGTGEFSSVSSFDSYFSNTTASYFASAGDNGAEVEAPAVSPYVVGVGGTSLTVDTTTGARATETTWSGSGGGTSAYVARPSYQNGFQTSTKRGVPDVAYNADPNVSGVYVYYTGNGTGTYYSVGGTSAGAPQWAGLAALVNQGRAANGLGTISSGLTYGLNTALYALAGGSTSGYTNARGDFFDVTSGSNGNAATTGYDTATGLGSPVANKLVPDLIAFGTSTPPTPTVPAVGDAGFEAVPVGSVGFNSFQYNPTGSAWTFGGQSGVSGNGSGFTSGNPNAPGGSQVAFLQNLGKASQAIANWAAGSYQISFQAAQRANYGSPNQSIQVLVDGNLVSTITPGSASYQAYTTAAFTVTAGAHTITLQGANASGDNTALVDGVAVATASSFSTSPAVGDSGFETAAAGPAGYAYNPAGSPWTFYGSSGVSANTSAFTVGNPNAPGGSQVAFLQNQGSIQQAVGNWAGGSYTLSFLAAQRGSNGGSNQTIQVMIDDKVVAMVTPGSTSYQTYTTPSFTVADGAHVITLLGLNGSGDNTAFLDNVAIAAAVTAPAVGDFGFETAAAGNGAGAYLYNPTGSAWTFGGQSGVSANNTLFTVGNPNAPGGSQVAFLQNQGTISQTISNWAAGSYTLSFLAAQRGNNGGSNQTFQVLVDNKVVATYNPSSTSYQSFTTASFAVGAGMHTITFQGTGPAGGDNTVFLDNVSLATA